MKARQFFLDFSKGAAIGVAMIIPGVSGGTLAVLMNVYDKLIDAFNNLRKDFKNSFLFLLPVLSGALVAFAAMYYPLKYALKYAPFPTVMLFAGLMLGSCPKIIKEGADKGFSKLNIISVIIPFAAVIGLCFIPGLGEADLSASMPVWGYFVLLLIGALASCALVIPGVSGSMLLLILGYYKPVLASISELKVDFGHNVLILFLFAVGIIVGFFSIAKLMKLFLTKYPRGTMWAIIGFVLGSVPAIFITYNGNFPDFKYETLDAVQISVGCVLCVAGIIGSFILCEYAKKKSAKPAAQIPAQENKEEN